MVWKLRLLKQQLIWLFPLITLAMILYADPIPFVAMTRRFKVSGESAPPIFPSRATQAVSNKLLLCQTHPDSNARPFYVDGPCTSGPAQRVTSSTVEVANGGSSSVSPSSTSLADAITPPDLSEVDKEYKFLDYFLSVIHKIFHTLHDVFHAYKAEHFTKIMIIVSCAFDQVRISSSGSDRPSTSSSPTPGQYSSTTSHPQHTTDTTGFGAATTKNTISTPFIGGSSNSRTSAIEPRDLFDFVIHMVGMCLVFISVTIMPIYFLFGYLIHISRNSRAKAPPGESQRDCSQNIVAMQGLWQDASTGSKTPHDTGKRYTPPCREPIPHLVPVDSEIYILPGF